MDPNTTLQNETRRSRIVRILLDYCAQSSIHGVLHLVDRRRNLADRVWWIVAIVTSIFLCSYMISVSFLNWKENPVILGLSRESMTLGEIPFPAITICPAIKTRASKFNYTDVYQAILKLDENRSRVVTEEESKVMSVAQQVCYVAFSRHIWEKLPDNYLDDNIVKQITDMAPKLEDTLVSCKFRNVKKNCDEYFTPTITEDGICYSFNALNSNDIISDETTRDFGEQEFVPSSNWNVEDGYSKLENVDTESYPYRVFASGPSSSLIVTLRVSLPDIDHLCGDPIQGFRIKFHNPGDDPQLWKMSYQMSPASLKLFHINPRGIKAMEEIRKYNPDVRQCFYRTERPLRYFKNYSLRNCEVECLSNHTLKRCECVTFSTPRSNVTKICGSAELECVRKVFGELFQPEIFDKCQCFPSCTSLEYDVEEFQSPFNLVDIYSRLNRNDKFNLKNATFSRIAVLFGEDEMIPFVRVESHTLIDLLASSGGLFGLFIGASLLSFAELLYSLLFHILFPTLDTRSSNLT